MSADQTIYFAVYDPATGTILRVGTCPASMMDIQAMPGQSVVQVPATTRWGEHRIENGVAVRI